MKEKLWMKQPFIYETVFYQGHKSSGEETAWISTLVFERQCLSIAIHQSADNKEPFRRPTSISFHISTLAPSDFCLFVFRKHLRSQKKNIYPWIFSNALVDFCLVRRSVLRKTNLKMIN